jgi:hypothetical protein
MAFDPRVDIGPVQVGAILSAAFFGCLVAQTYMYYRMFPKDPLKLKLIASFCRIVIQLCAYVWTGGSCRVWLSLLRLMLSDMCLRALQLGHFFCLIATMWSMTVLAYAHPSILKTFPIGADILILLSSFTCSLVQASVCRV